MSSFEAFISSSALWLPPDRCSAAEAVAQDDITAVEMNRLDVSSVRIATESAPDMAIRAAEQALGSSPVEASDIDLLAHSHTYFQGHDFWSPAHYIARRTGAIEASPVSVTQLCNAGAAALKLALSHSVLRSRPVMVTTADAFLRPGFDRWGGDFDTVYGDGATCLILTPQEPSGSNVLKIRALEMRSCSEFEEMYRGGDEFSPAPRSYRSVVDVRATKRFYFGKAGGTSTFQKTATEAISRLVSETMDSASITVKDVKTTLLPRLSPKVLSLMYVGAIHPDLEPTTQCLREETGHLGAGDFAANLDHLRSSPDFQIGDVALVLGGGGGFTWSCAVVEKTR